MSEKTMGQADEESEKPGPLSPHLVTLVEEIEKLYDNEDPLPILGLKTGFENLDVLTSGLHPGNLIVVAARPNMGDTSFITNIAAYTNFKEGTNVAFFSMKMHQHQITRRLIASIGQINISSLVSASLLDEKWPSLTEALGRLNEANIHLLDNKITQWTSAGVELALENIEGLNQPSLLIIDGLQYFDVSNVSTAYDRNIQLGEQIRQLKKMAMKRNIPIVVTATLTRELESRPNKRPVLRDIRDIGMLEDIADTILFIHRPEVYDLDFPDKGLAEIIVAKQQHGPLGTVNLLYRDEICRFDNIK